MRYLAGLLEEAAANGLKLCISCPPGHGKSTLLQCFVAWFLGKEPSSRILAISASESLAKRNSRDTQALVTSDNWPFPNVKLVTDSVLEWTTNYRGEVRAIGKGGTISGFRAHGILCDDLQSDAGSETSRASDYEWFRGVLTTRLEPSAWAVIIQTRWNDTDIIGQIKDSESCGQWQFVNLSAIAGENDVLGRSEGEALWPSRWPIEKIEAKKVEVGSSIFSSLYAGDPIPSGGLLFKELWLSHTYSELPTIRCDDPGFQLREASTREGILFDTYGVKPRALQPLVIQAIDGAWRTGASNDRSAIVTIVSDGVNFYIADVFADRLEYTDLRRAVVNQYDKWHPSRLFVEMAASGFSLVSEIKKSTGIPVIGVNPGRESKEARVESLTGLFEAGRILWPTRGAWLEDALNEFRRFPHGRHDDIVDATTIALREAQRILRIQANRSRTDPKILEWWRPA